jgi:hypothetical protein
VASESGSITRYYADHRWFVVGGIAAAIGALVGIVQLRKSPPAVTVTLPAGATGTAAGGFAASDVSNAYAAGSAATAAGAAPLVGIGQGGLDLAAQALQSESGTLTALGGTQASMGGSLSQTIAELGSLIATQQAPVVAQQPVAAPTPVAAAPVATISSDPAVRLIAMDGVTEVKPTQSTYQLGPAAMINGFSLTGSPTSAVHIVSQGGQSYYLLDRNIASYG